MTHGTGTADATEAHTENTADATDLVDYVGADAGYQETIWNNYAAALAAAAAAGGLAPNVQALDDYFATLAGDPADDRR